MTHREDDHSRLLRSGRLKNDHPSTICNRTLRTADLIAQQADGHFKESVREAEGAEHPGPSALC